VHEEVQFISTKSTKEILKYTKKFNLIFHEEHERHEGKDPLLCPPPFSKEQER
jgi:hypothetical protein